MNQDRHPHGVNLVPKVLRPKLMLGRAQGIPSEGERAAAWILWLNPSTVTIARYADFCDAHDDGYAVAVWLGLEFEVETEDCELVLTPVVSVSARELALLQNPEVASKLRRSIAQAEAGELKDYGPGHFSDLAAQYGEDEE